MSDRRNVEFKARTADPEAVVAAALAAGAEDLGLLEQRDTYFRVARGRLKLREQSDGAWLIPYERADDAQTRLSSYALVDVDDPAALASALADTAGVDVVVEKRRRLLMLEGVRVHVDDVAGLGTFVELEAVLAHGSDLIDESLHVEDLRRRLGIDASDVVAEGYAQMLAAEDRAARVAATDIVGAALAARERAYAPYSQFAVGAALRDETGAVHAAANVENAAFPQGQCAEASAIGTLVAAGGRRIVEVAVAGDAPLITPCGGCRQRLSEFAAADAPVHLCGPEGVRRTVTLGELLPLAFASGDLPG